MKVLVLVNHVRSEGIHQIKSNCNENCYTFWTLKKINRVEKCGPKFTSRATVQTNLQPSNSLTREQKHRLNGKHWELIRNLQWQMHEQQACVELHWHQHSKIALYIKAYWKNTIISRYDTQTHTSKNITEM